MKTDRELHGGKVMKREREEWEGGKRRDSILGLGGVKEDGPLRGV